MARVTLTAARRAELEADLVLFRTKLRDVRLNGATTSVSHGNGAGSRSISRTAVGEESLKRVIDETLIALGLPAEFGGARRPFRPALHL